MKNGFQSPHIGSACAALGVTLWIAGSALAASATAQVDETAAVRAAEALTAAESALATRREATLAIQSSTGEELAIAIDRSERAREQLLSHLEQALEWTRESDIEDPLLSTLTARAARLASSASDEMRANIDASAERIEELRSERDAAPAAERAVFDETISELVERSDAMLAALFDLSQRKESLAVSPQGDLDFLDRALRERSERLAAIVRVSRARLAVLDRQKEAGEDHSPEVLAETALLEGRLEFIADGLDATLSLMDKRGLPTAELRQLLITATGEVTSDIFRREVAVGLIEAWGEQGADWLRSNGPAALFKTLLFFVVMIGFHGLALLAVRVVRRAMGSARVKASKLVEEFTLKMAYRAVMAVGLLVVLSQVGVAVGPLLAGLGVAGFIVGFALQDTLSNFAAGLMILFYRPFDVGDVVEAGGVQGKVSQMTLVSTTILTFDNQRLIVPNNKIWGDVIRNVTAQEHRRVDMVFGVSYSDDIEQTEKILSEIVHAHELVLDTPPPVIQLHELGDSSVNFIVRPWAATPDYWQVYWDVTRTVKRRFDEAGISIPFPQSDVHLISPHQEKADT